MFCRPTPCSTRHFGITHNRRWLLPLNMPLLVLFLFLFGSYLSHFSLPISSMPSFLPFTLTLSLCLAGSQGRCCCTRAPQAWASTSLVGRMGKVSSSPSSWQEGRLTWAASWGGATGFFRSVSQPQALWLPTSTTVTRLRQFSRPPLSE